MGPVKARKQGQTRRVLRRGKGRSWSLFTAGLFRAFRYIVEPGRKIDEEKKEGKLEREKGREPLTVPSPSPQSPLVFPLVFLAYDFTRSTPSEHRRLGYSSRSQLALRKMA